MIRAESKRLVSRRNGWLATLIVLCALAPSGSVRGESTESSGGFYGWSPFLESALALHMQKFDSSGSSSIGVASRKATVLSVLAVRFGGGIRGPRSETFPGAPRLVLRGGIALPTRSSSTLVSETQSFGMLPDQDQRSSRFGVQWGSQWETSLGLQFELPLEPFDLRLTPSLAYMGTRIRYEGEFSVRTPPTVNPLTPSMLFEIGGNASSTQHFLGPRLELEFAFAPVRRVKLSLFLDSRAFWRINSAHERFSFSGDIDGSLETGTIIFDSEALAGSISFGVRGAFW